MAGPEAGGCEIGRVGTRFVAGALAVVDVELLNLRGWSEEIRRSYELSPGNARAITDMAYVLADKGQAEEAISLAQRAIALDPVNGYAQLGLGEVYFRSRRYPESIQAFDRATSIDKTLTFAYVFKGYAEILSDDSADALKDCSLQPALDAHRVCRAIAYHKLGRDGEAQGELTALRTAFGDTKAYERAEIYAQWGDLPQALKALETADRLRNASLQSLRADPFLDPLRGDPRFQVIEHKLSSPA